MLTSIDPSGDGGCPLGVSTYQKPLVQGLIQGFSNRLAMILSEPTIIGVA